MLFNGTSNLFDIPSNRMNKLVFIFLGTIVSIWIGIYNGYPIVYPDSGTYIRCAFEMELAPDRPYLYSWFLRHTSMRETFFFSIIFQALIVNYLLYRWTQCHLKKYLLPYFIGVVLVSFLSTLSVFTSQLIPDIFTSTMILSGLLILNHLKQMLLIERVIVAFIFVFSVATHTSHFLIASLFLIFFVIVNRKQIRSNFQHWVLFFTLLLTSFFGVMTINYSLDGKFQYSGSTYIFLTSKLYQMGVMQEYLYDRCPENPHPLCKEIKGMHYKFLWNYNSPLYIDLGGWEDANDKLKPLVWDLFSKWEYAKKALLHGFFHGSSQIFRFKAEYYDMLHEGETAPVFNIRE